MKKPKLLSVLIVLFLVFNGCTSGSEDSNLPGAKKDTLGFSAEFVLAGPDFTGIEKTMPETEPVIYAEDITFTGEYIRDGVHMPYALFSPSSAKDCEKVPLVVFLHGRGECNAGENWFMHTGMTQIMEDWSLDGFNAYVICPQLYGQWNPGSWSNEIAAEFVMELLHDFSAEHNVDTDNIIIVGFSAGALGAMHMAHEYPDYFSKLVVMSSPATDCPRIDKITIPAVGYSETAVSFNSFMKEKFLSVFGADSVHYYDVGHIYVPEAAFNDDTDGNHRSDLVEWMLNPS